MMHLFTNINKFIKFYKFLHFTSAGTNCCSTDLQPQKQNLTVTLRSFTNHLLETFATIHTIVSDNEISH